jgi:hypothetical protein
MPGVIVMETCHEVFLTEKLLTLDPPVSGRVRGNPGFKTLGFRSGFANPGFPTGPRSFIRIHYKYRMNKKGL